MAACTVGDVSGQLPPGSAPSEIDDSSGSSVDAGSPVGDPADAAPVTPTPDAGGLADPDCKPLVQSLASGRHNPGTACLECHNGQQGPAFSTGGTLYTTAAGGTPKVGATITLLDANGVTHELISAQNGNFWSEANIAFPATASASGCPTTLEMQGAVQDNGADCNTGGCHTAGNRVYLP